VSGHYERRRRQLTSDDPHLFEVVGELALARHRQREATTTDDPDADERAIVDHLATLIGKPAAARVAGLLDDWDGPIVELIRAARQLAD
jgi:hypothetical protein